MLFALEQRYVNLQTLVFDLRLLEMRNPDRPIATTDRIGRQAGNYTFDSDVAMLRTCFPALHAMIAPVASASPYDVERPRH